MASGSRSTDRSSESFSVPGDSTVGAYDEPDSNGMWVNETWDPSQKWKEGWIPESLMSEETSDEEVKTRVPFSEPHMRDWPISEQEIYLQLLSIWVPTVLSLIPVSGSSEESICGGERGEEELKATVPIVGDFLP